MKFLNSRFLFIGYVILFSHLYLIAEGTYLSKGVDHWSLCLRCIFQSINQLNFICKTSFIQVNEMCKKCFTADWKADNETEQMWTVCCCLILFYYLPPLCSLSLLSSIPIPSSSVCHVSRSSLRRPQKKIWMSWFSPCWSTATQRKWTRGSVSVLSSFFFYPLTSQSVSLSLSSLLRFCISLSYTWAYADTYVYTQTRHCHSLWIKHVSYHNPCLPQPPPPRYIWFLFFPPLVFPSLFLAHTVPLSCCLSLCCLS